MLGLVVGKPVGIFLASFAAVRLGLGRLPDDTSWSMILGLGAVGGIGFTVSIFIAGLSFPGADLLTEEAKIAILLASLARRSHRHRPCSSPPPRQPSRTSTSRGQAGRTTRKRQPAASAAAGRHVLDRDLTVVGLDDPLDDREPEAGARGVDVLHLGVLGSTRRGAAVADLEEPLAGVVRDAAAAVGDRELDATLDRPGEHVHGAVGGRVADAVDDEVGQDAREPGGVGVDLQPVGHLAAEAYATDAGHRVGSREGLADEVADETACGCTTSWPAWMRESSKRSSTISTMRSTSPRICRW